MIVSGLSVNDAFKYSIMKTCIGFVGVGVGMYLMRHVFGRRTIMMLGAFLQGMCLLAMAVTATTSAGTEVARNSVIAFVALFFFFYNALVGDASYPVATELASTGLRSWTVGSAISLGYFLAWLASFCSPYFINPENLNWVRPDSEFSPLKLLTVGAGSQVRLHLGRVQLHLWSLLLLLLA